jgi:hypothetical protein
MTSVLGLEMRTTGVLTLLVASTAAVVGCGADTINPAAGQSVQVEIAPTNVQATPRQRVAFASVVTGTALTAVVWTVVETSGGTIDANGLYTAPSTGGTYHVTASSVANPAAVASATVAVSPAPVGVAGGCASEPIRSTGAKYYFCDCQAGASTGCVAGNDANAGTDINAPKRTLSAATTIFSNMNGGDTVAFCRGGRWAAGSWGGPTNSRCTATSTCDVRSYAPPWGGNGARPYFPYNGSGNSFWDFGNGTTTNGYMRFQGLEVRGGGSSTQDGAFVYNGAHDILWCDNLISGFRYAFYFVNSLHDQDVTLQPNLNVVSNVVTDNYHGGYLGASSGGHIDYNTFARNGVAGGGRDHNVYLANADSPNNNANAPLDAANMSVSNNYFADATAYGTTSCQDGASLVGHGIFSNLLIAGNYFENTVPGATGCWGIGLGRDADSTSYCQFNAPIIRGNVLKNLGNTVIELDNSHGAIIENNLVIGTPGLEQRGISHATGGSLNGGVKQWVSQNSVIRNNTIYISGSSNYAYGVMVGGENGGHEVYNNAAWVTGSGTTCYSLSGTTYAPGSTCSTGSGCNACTTSGSSTWFSATSPVYQGTTATAGGADFVPGASSPLLNAGTTRGGLAPTTDITGKTRDAAPDAGGFER